MDEHHVRPALHFIQVDSKFMLPAPSATGELLQKKKGRSISNAVQIYGRCFSIHSAGC